MLYDDPERNYVWYLKHQVNSIGFSGGCTVNLRKVLSDFAFNGIGPYFKALIVYDKENNTFFLENPDKHKVFLDGEEFPGGKREKLETGSVISLGAIGQDFVFYPIEFCISTRGTDYNLAMNKPTVIGRQGDIKVAPELQFHASERHCSVQFDFKKNRFFIMDLGSANGTFVNGKKIGKFPKVYLKDRDEIQFAPAHYGFEEHLIYREYGRHFLKDRELHHLPSVKQRIEEEIKEKEFNSFKQKFYRGVEEIFSKHGFLDNSSHQKPFRWRELLGSRFCGFGKGGDCLEPCSHDYQNTKNPVCQHCFKIFINPTSDGFLEVFDRALQILDDNLKEFKAKVIGSADGFRMNSCEEIIVYCRSKEDCNKSVKEAHESVLQLVDILKKGLKDLEKYADPIRSRSYLSKKVTGLVYYRQGGSYHRGGENFDRPELFAGENRYLFNTNI
ncbi:FHA domain-containing protein [Candidatus Woesearchaeota archaeon]|nr:FHA domain-containing protein [Candidatus Woesearchaeota archaeon]